MDRRIQDCYFFYYSTCTKGEHCGFRHEPSALGCETVCQFWQQGKCTNQQCHLRHMELKKNRKTIPCYWETQPGGCRKQHCPFLHKAARDANAQPANDVKQRAEQVARNPPAAQQPVQPVVQQQLPPQQHPAMSPMQEPLIVSFQETMHMY